MKKTYLLIIAVALAFAGCSKVGPEHSDPNAWMYDESLPVPIMLGTPGTQVLTKVGFDGSQLPEDTEIGVMGLEFGNQTWNNDASKSESVLIDCKESATIGGSGEIIFKTTKFYPLTGGQNFRFYGFYPYKGTNGTPPSLQNAQYYELKYTINGETDILWAEDEAEDFLYTNEDFKKYKVSGYNATYIRRVNTYASEEDKKRYLPNLKFEHKLTAFTFRLRADEEALKDLGDATLAVTGLTITDTYTQAKLVVANCDENDKVHETGLLYGVGDLGSIELKGVQEGGIVFRSDGNASDIEFGNGILLLSATQYTAELYMTLTKSDGTSKDYTAELVFKRNGGEEFEAGSQYNFTIIVRAPQDIVIQSELAAWENTETITIDQINNNGSTETAVE